MGTWMGKRWDRGWEKDGNVDEKKMEMWIGKRWERGWEKDGDVDG